MPFKKKFKSRNENVGLYFCVKLVETYIFKTFILKLSCKMQISPPCCDMDQSDTIGKIELFPSIVLSSDNTDYKNDIQLFPQLFDELSVHTDYHKHLQAL